jgi:hypothetical protein
MASLAPYASIVLSLISVLSVFYLGSVKIAKIEVKVDTMWDFQMRRAFSEAVKTGVGTVNSPLTFVPEFRAKLDPMKNDLRSFWEKYKYLPVQDFIVQLEAYFGNRITKEICIPLGLSHGACLLMALAVAKDVDSLDLDELILAKVYH